MPAVPAFRIGVSDGEVASAIAGMVVGVARIKSAASPLSVARSKPG
jgi:hypothetical protein